MCRPSNLDISVGQAQNVRSHTRNTRTETPENRKRHSMILLGGYHLNLQA